MTARGPECDRGRVCPPHVGDPQGAGHQGWQSQQTRRESDDVPRRDGLQQREHLPVDLQDLCLHQGGSGHSYRQVV